VIDRQTFCTENPLVVPVQKLPQRLLGGVAGKWVRRTAMKGVVSLPVLELERPPGATRDPDPDRHACSIPPFLQDSEGKDRSGDPGSSMVFREDFLAWSQAASSSLNSASGCRRIMVR